jgi:hypothetical protein
MDLHAFLFALNIEMLDDDVLRKKIKIERTEKGKREKVFGKLDKRGLFGTLV